MKSVYALSLLAAAASALTFKNDPFWASYKAKFSKAYAHEAEESRRYDAFTRSMARAAEFNKMDDLATYGMTVMSDRLPEEISTKLSIPEGLEEAPAPSPRRFLAFLPLMMLASPT